jgi:large subunit ribosomal protein L31
MKYIMKSDLPTGRQASKVMKQDIHPTYYPNAKATCGCGKVFSIGATLPEIQVEICSNCHPFFTGKEKLIDTAGKVEQFKARKAKAAAAPKKEKKVRKSNKVA